MPEQRWVAAALLAGLALLAAARGLPFRPRPAAPARPLAGAPSPLHGGLPAPGP
ncbi:MAG: hypothetical protein ACM3RP_01530 [Chitinophagales bacterium]